MYDKIIRTVCKKQMRPGGTALGKVDKLKINCGSACGNLETQILPAISLSQQVVTSIILLSKVSDMPHPVNKHTPSYNPIADTLLPPSHYIRFINYHYQLTGDQTRLDFIIAIMKMKISFSIIACCININSSLIYEGSRNLILNKILVWI